MVKIVEVLTMLAEEDKWQLFDFEDFMSRYSKLEVSKLGENLKSLEEARMIQFQREEFGFRIIVSDMERLRNYK